VPLNDRDYMKPSPPKRANRGRFSLNSFNFDLVIWIIGLNLAVYLVSLISTSFFGRSLVPILGLSPSLFTEKPWTILTNMFTHTEFWHIFGNMLTLYFFGRVVYKIMGTGRFIIVYLVGGLVGNLLYLWLGNPLSIAIGASGAVYALAGTLVVLMPKMKVFMWFVIPLPLWVVVLVFFVAWSFIPGVAWQAHIGGLAVGLIAGWLYRRQMRHIIYR
jgi:membrane associated rhomboid family serine protease